LHLRPLHDRIVVKRIVSVRTTAAGIVMPASAAEKPEQGEVPAIGQGKPQDTGEPRAVTVQVGDRVLFGKYAGQSIKVDGQELLVMREDDVMAIVDVEAEPLKKAA